MTVRAPGGKWPTITVAIVSGILGTGGCSAVLASAGQLISSVNSGNALVAQRLATIESKLDSWRDEQHETKARINELAREADRSRNQVRQLETLVEAYRKGP